MHPVQIMDEDDDADDVDHTYAAAGEQRLPKGKSQPWWIPNNKNKRKRQD
jgi:hypothetical protein